MSQPYAYGVLEYPDGTGSNPVKRKKKKIIFLYFFYSLLYFPFLLLLCLLNITINILVIYLWSIIIHQCSWTSCFEMV